MMNRKLFYPNGEECLPVDPNADVYTYNIKATTKNGFKNDEQVTLYYQFQTPVDETDHVRIPIHVTVKSIPLPPTPTTTLPDNYKSRNREIEIKGTAVP